MGNGGTEVQELAQDRRLVDGRAETQLRGVGLRVQALTRFAMLPLSRMQTSACFVMGWGQKSRGAKVGMAGEEEKGTQCPVPLAGV